MHRAPEDGICTDLAKAGRVACGGGKLFEWSDDAGETWRCIPGNPPRPAGRMAFVGDRIIVGTGGSGLFRSPELPAGRK